MGLDEVAPPRQLFVRRAIKDGRTVVVLRGLEIGGECAIDAEVNPVTGSGSDAVPVGTHTFPTLDDALTYVEEALLALEYLGCSIASGTVESNGESPGPP